MKKKPAHYYPDNKPDSDMTTACGKDGRETGGLIAFFFGMLKSDERCEVCDRQFKEDQRETPTNQTTKIQ